MRIRIGYSVFGKIRFISHLDLMRAFSRACIRAGIPVAVTKGFTPHLKMSFGPPLSVGMTSSGEILDMYTEKEVDTVWLKEKLQEVLPEGITIDNINEVPIDEPSLCASLDRAVYRIKIQPDRTTDMAEIKDGEIVVDVPIGQGRHVKSADVLLGIWPDLKEDELKLQHIHREKLYNERDNY